MTLYTFQLMPPGFQLTWVFAKGTYLAHRWQNGSGVNLYYLPDEGCGFFIEVGYDETSQDAVVLRSFSSSVLLEEYTQGVRLPD